MKTVFVVDNLGAEMNDPKSKGPIFKPIYWGNHAEPTSGMGYNFITKQYYRHVILKGKTVMVKAPNRGGPWTRMRSNLF